MLTNMQFVNSKPKLWVDTLWPRDSRTSKIERAVRTTALVLVGLVILTLPEYTLTLTAAFSVIFQALIVALLGMSYGWRLGGATFLLYFFLSSFGWFVMSHGNSLDRVTDSGSAYVAGFGLIVFSVGCQAEKKCLTNWKRTLPATVFGLALVLGCNYL